MDPTMMFNAPNFIYWLCLAVIIAIETTTLPKRTPENVRWLIGYATLFGTSYLMVAHHGWDYHTWLLLLLLSGAYRLAHIDHHLLAFIGRLAGEDLTGLWDHPKREAHRWTAQYFGAWLTAIPFTLWAGADILTWGLLFFSLGICGAIKVGWAGIHTSLRARRLRQKEETPDGPTCG